MEQKTEMITRPSASSVMAAVAQSREVAEIQAAMLVAKNFPRDTVSALDRIRNACQRPGLAEVALYTYSRGGTDIQGPSIRLAEAIAQQWGNLSFGIRELEQRSGESTVEAFCYDLEVNTRQTKVFQVRHERHTKKGSYALSDPRDVYELVANQGARRLRACILGIIPGDIVEAAVGQCEETMKAKADTSPEAIKKMLSAFFEFGVTKDQIEKRIQRRIDAITPAQVISLRKIYNSLRDGMSSPVDWFEITPETSAQEKLSGVEAGKEKLKGKTKATQTEPVLKEPPAPPSPPEMAPDICPDGGTMAGDRPTVAFCGSCAMRDGCPVWPVTE